VALNQLVLAPLAMTRSVPGHDVLDLAVNTGPTFDTVTVAEVEVARLPEPSRARAAMVWLPLLVVVVSQVMA
jgi:hypothetical protein